MHCIRSSLAIVVTALLLAACTSNPLVNLENRTVPSRLDGSAQTTETVKKGIIAGCLDKGWTCREVTPGLIEASIDVRKHHAEANIAYDTEHYSITYKDSELLDYNNHRNTIHRNYNRWIANLDAEIKKNLTL